MRAARLTALLGLGGLAACVQAQDNPSRVEDLRVLAVQVEPPELMAETCDFESPLSFFVYATPVTYRALVADPMGEGRTVTYELFACPSQSDRLCEEERVPLADGGTVGGELSLQVSPVLEPSEGGGFPSPRTISDGGVLLTETLLQDTYKGLGGVRLPLVLHVQAGEEEVWAQKLMVYSCKRFQGQEQNENPVLPGLRLQGEAWGAEVLPLLTGAGPFDIASEDVSALERTYVVPTLEAEPQPLELKESWQVSWHTDYGRIGPVETGGTDITGGVGRHEVRWFPPSRDAEARERVRVWAVVRDGRGGQSWLERAFRYEP